MNTHPVGLGTKTFADSRRPKSYFGDRERALEDLWFSEKEHEMFKNMMEKMKRQRSALYGEHGKTKARENLIAIFEEHKVELTPSTFQLIYAKSIGVFCSYVRPQIKHD